MTREELLLAVGDVEEALLESCQQKPRRKIWKIAAAAALVACIAAGAAAMWKPQEETPVPPQWECTLLSTMNGTPDDLALRAADAAEVWNRGTFQDPEAPREMTVTWDGVSYTGQYAYSIYPVGCGYIKDYYQSASRDAAFDEFSVHRETGRLTGINLATGAFFAENKTREALEDPSNMLPELARQWASYFIDTEQYTMRLTRRVPQQDSNMVTYYYEFVRQVNGLGTTDLLQIMISDRGILGYVGTKQLGWVAEYETQLEAFAGIDPKELILRDTNLTGVTVQEQYYGITPQGKPVLMVRCSVKVAGGMSAGAILVIENIAA